MTVTEPLASLALVAIGVVAGTSTTVSGVGGALIALAAASLMMPARAALAITSAALLVGSVHRIWVYRREIDGRVAAKLGAGMVAGALMGAQLVTQLPELVLRGALVAVAGLAIGSAIAGFVVRLSPRAMIGSGLAIGVIGASAGGAALLIGPVLQALGLQGERYVSTSTATAVIFNAARVAGYLASGLYESAMLEGVAVLSAACVAGNVIGVLVRRRIPARSARAVELGAPVVALVLALVGA